MSYVIYNPTTGMRLAHANTDRVVYETERAAKAARTKDVGNSPDWVVIPYDVWANLPKKMKTVINLMSGLPVEIPVDTPWCCDPSTETYWSA